MAKAYAEFMYEQLHKAAPYHDGSFQSWVKEQSESHPYRYDTGVRIWVSLNDEAPEDRFMDDPAALPKRLREFVEANDET